MRIVVNGAETEIDDGLTVAELLRRVARERSTPLAACAVEVNRRLVPRRQHDEQRLGDGDVVEIVTLVGGG
ncbi:MAG: sulfur carrier protein ThiS [Phycisphaerales bacterium]